MKIGRYTTPTQVRPPRLMDYWKSLTEAQNNFSESLRSAADEIASTYSSINYSLIETSFEFDLDEAAESNVQDVLLEEMGDSLIEKIRELFKKILDGIMSIINKLKAHIDSMFMNGKELVKKYHDTVSEKNLTNVEVNVYSFDHIPEINTSLESGDLSNLIEKANPGWKILKDATKNDKDLEGDQGQNNVDTALDAAKSIDKGEFEWKLAKELISGSGQNEIKDEDWLSDYKDFLYGNKEKHRCIERGLDQQSIEYVLTHPDKLKEIQKQYENLTRIVKTCQASFESKRNDKQKAYDNVKDKNTVEARKKKLRLEIRNLKLRTYTIAFDTIGKLKKLATDYYTDRYNQARYVYGKMVAGSPK